MATDPTANNELERAIVGALRDQIKAHGPITPDWIGSAAKRVLGQLGNAKLTGLARALGKQRWKDVPPEEQAAISAKGGRRRWKGVSAAAHAQVTAAGGRKAWEGVSAEERSRQMKERARVRAANKAAKEKA